MKRTIDRTELVVRPGHAVRLSDFDPASTCGLHDKGDAKQKLEADIVRLAALQDIFYAASKCALLIVFQGMDAAGKDGAIKHVMSGVNAQGVTVTSFKEPSRAELAHDYLWRSTAALPARGHFGIFNRSYYEEVAVVRVHANLLDNESIAGHATGSALWKERFEDIVAFERHLSRNGTIVLKFLLNVSKDEQRERLLDRIDTPAKNWKLSVSDVRERTFWDRYQQAYEEILSHTSTDFAPWHVIPADRKWVSRAAVADVIVARLEALGFAYPEVGAVERAQLLAEREQLTRDG